MEYALTQAGILIVVGVLTTLYVFTGARQADREPDPDWARSVVRYTGPALILAGLLWAAVQLWVGWR